jgi:hypothetical protein
MQDAESAQIDQRYSRNILNGAFVCPLPTAHCPLPTAHCPLPTAHCPLSVVARQACYTQPLVLAPHLLHYVFSATGALES